MIILNSAKYLNVYRGTITGLRISAVDGTAFIDASNASVTALADGNHLIEIYDASGRMISGFLKAQGTGETTTNIYTSDFSAGAGGWTGVRATVVGNIDGIGGQDDVLRLTVTDVTNNTHFVPANVTLIALKLYYVSFKYYLLSTNSDMNQLGAYRSTGIIGSVCTTTDAWTTITKSFMPISTGIGLNFFGGKAGSTTFQDAGGDDIFYLKDVVVDEITAPSTSGATIVNSKGGTTYNWLYKNASFTYNAASYYVIVKKVR